nr:MULTISPECIES: hypothetical protein [Paenibacillus]
MLKDDSDGRGGGLLRISDCAAGRLGKSGQQAQQSRFAASCHAAQHRQAAFRKLQVNIRQGGEGAVAIGYGG